MFSARVSQKELALLARNLGVSLHSGVAIVRAFEISSRKAHGVLKEVLDDIVAQLKSGSDVASAVAAHGNFFPSLFVDMLHVGESSGALPEVLKALGTHYENNIRLRKEFVSQITLPAVQFLAAIFIIAGLIFLLGILPVADILGWGLTGGTGALMWLGGWAMLGAAIYFGYRVTTATLSGQKAIHRWLLSLPVIGRCLRSFAIARFSWGFHLTQQAGMPIDDSLEASLRATSNGAFLAAAPEIISEVHAGETLTDALEHTRLFPVEFIETVHVAETSGTVPEALDRLSPQFEDDARRSLQALSVAAGWTIWGLVALFIIALIFKLAMFYAGILDGALKDVNGI